MANFQKKKVFFAIPLILVIIVTALYFAVFNKRNNNLSALLAVPEQTYFTFGVKDINVLVDDLTDNEIIRFWSSDEKLESNLSDFKKICKVLLDNSYFRKKLIESQLFISAVPVQNHFDFLFIIELNSSPKFSSLISNFNEIKEDLRIVNLIQRKGNSEFDIITKNKTWFFYVHENILCFSSNSDLLSQASLSLKDPKTTLPENWSEEINENYRIYYKNDRLREFIALYLDENIVPLKIIPENSVIRINLNKQNIQLVFDGQNPKLISGNFYDKSFSEILTLLHAYSFIGFSQFENLNNNEILNQNSSLFDNNFVEVLFDVEAGESDFPLIKIFKIRDLSQTLKFLKQNSGPLTANELKTYNLDTLKLGVLKEKMFNSVFFAIDSLDEKCYYAVYQNYLLVSSNLKTFEKFVFYVSNNLLADNKLLGLPENFNLKIKVPEFYPLLLAGAILDKRNLWEENFNRFSSLSDLVFTISSDNKLKVDISFDSLAVFSFLERKINFLYNNFKNRNIDSLLIFPSLQDSLKDGRQNFYYEEGNIKATGFYQDGKAKGLWRFYYPNGNIQSAIEFVDNQANGKCIIYSEFTDASMIVVCSFLEGKLHNQYIELHKSGRPSLVLSFNKGEINTKLRFFYTQSSIFAEAEVGEDMSLKNIKYYSILGDFIDINNFNTTSSILINYEAFISRFIH